MMQGTGLTHRSLPLGAAEHEYALSLTRHAGEQYELMPPAPGETLQHQSPLYTLRHVVRSKPTTVKVLGIYYILEGVIYKSPCVRSLMKANVTRTIEGLAQACNALSACARYDPSTGYVWDFDTKDEDRQTVRPKRQRQRRILDSRRPGERTPEEEEGIRASEAIDNILLRLSKSAVVVQGKVLPE